MVSTTGKEQPWLKVDVAEDLTWLDNQKVQDIYGLSKHIRELSLGFRSSKGMDTQTFKG
jgi:hypothetical protein